MSQFPRPHFNPLRRKVSARDFSLILRHVLAIGLAALLFLAPLSFAVNAQQPTSGSGSSSKVPDGDYFIVYQSADGDVTCREATLAERIEMGRNRAGNLHQINHLKSSFDEYAHSDSVQGGDNDLPAHLTIVLRATDQLNLPENALAKAAFIRAAANWESQVLSPVTLYIDADFGATNFGATWGSGVLGSTSSPSISSVPYQSVRNNLIAGASNAAETNLYTNLLPATTVPTDLGDASTVSVSSSIARAIGLLNPTALSTDNAARIGFNSNFRYDFDPSDGITPDPTTGQSRTDFEAVATHEIGHALGFTSRSGQGSSTPAIWDLFRFRTGTTDSSFKTAQRIMTIGGPTGSDPLQFYFVPGSTEVGLSNGGPSGATTNNADGNQSSHWRNAAINPGGYIGIMDPKIPSNTKRVITSNDTNALNTFGYNLDNSNPPPPLPPPPPAPANDNFASAQAIAGCTGSIVGTNVGATKETGEPSHDPGGSTGGGSVWYLWTAPTSGSVTINTTGNATNYDTVLAVYTGSAVNALGTAVARNDDVDPGVVTSSTVTFNATAGTVYKIAVDGWGGETGNFALNWTEANCTQATTVQLNQGSYAVNEGAGSASVVVTRTDTTAAATVNYSTSDTAGLQNCNVTGTGIASSRCDYATSIGTVRFAIGESTKTISIPIVDDNFAEGNESFTITLSNPVGASLGGIQAATVTITDNANTGGNPADQTAFFVRQHYIDFLGREPDPSGFAGWQNSLNTCKAGDTTCDRIEVSSGFFRSAEFQERGYFTYRFYSVALGRKPLFAEFMPDLAKVSGFLTDAEKEANKVAFVNEFMTRQEFRNRYDAQTTPTAYVNALLTTAGLPNHPSAPGWIAGLQGGTMTRADVLRALAESSEAYAKFYNEAFVVMQYFGYLRREPDGAYLDWIGEINKDPNNYRAMINGFMNSLEYRQRFGP
jgi:hypothetical protein